MDNKEDVLAALEEFEQKSTPNDQVPDILHSYLVRIAKTGKTVYSWDKLKPLFLHKLNHAMLEFHEKNPSDHILPSPNVENVKFEEMRNRIMDMAATFSGAPFTIQRLCELITNPQMHYHRTDKFLRGIEKNVLIVSTVDPLGNKIVNESKFVCNGLEANGVEAGGLHTPEAGELRTPEKVSSPFLPPPPTNSPVMSLFEGTTVADSPSPLLHSWPPSGSGDSMTTATSATSSAACSDPTEATISSALDQPNWEAGFEDYLPPEKKPRLTATPPSSEISTSFSDNNPESGSTPSMSDLFEQNIVTSDSHSASQTQSKSPDCEADGSVMDTETTALHSEINSSADKEAVSSSESLQLSPSSQFLQGTSDCTATSTNPVVNSLTTEANRGADSASDEKNKDGTGCLDDKSDNATIEGMDIGECEDTSGVCRVHPDIEQQGVEDGTDRRDSQGFDVSPKNPEGGNSPSSEPDSSPSAVASSESISPSDGSSLSETVVRESRTISEADSDITSAPDVTSTSSSSASSATSSSSSSSSVSSSASSDSASSRQVSMADGHHMDKCDSPSVSSPGGAGDCVVSESTSDKQTESSIVSSQSEDDSNSKDESVSSDLATEQAAENS